MPLCVRRHRIGNDSYHRLGPRTFGEVHDLDLAAIVRRLNLKPTVRIQHGQFIADQECRIRPGRPEAESLQLSGIFGTYAEKTVLL